MSLFREASFLLFLGQSIFIWFNNRLDLLVRVKIFGGYLKDPTLIVLHGHLDLRHLSGGWRNVSVIFCDLYADRKRDDVLEDDFRDLAVLTANGRMNGGALGDCFVRV